MSLILLRGLRDMDGDESIFKIALIFSVNSKPEIENWCPIRAWNMSHTQFRSVYGTFKWQQTVSMETSLLTTLSPGELRSDSDLHRAHVWRFILDIYHRRMPMLWTWSELKVPYLNKLPASSDILKNTPWRLFSVLFSNLSPSVGKNLIRCI